ncbi:Cytosolic Fe-S cluster assembly factor NUBP2 isoform 1 [Schistosoma japonicum]|uniref:Cytosolic Fe-S cluster assembly factor NUBP2 isoform 1 n=1 Tax=Schistosoma japonicum TaxID=6182 RepID=A0A4Z2DBG9_SCHJA|nr:Cytosolic Fe-S cluster assembly factor NUBP2 isoform 1 [Schistosoma japonicum]
MTVDRCLYIGNINSKITTELLYELFLQAGPLEDVTVKDTFAFVTFEDEESVPYACSLFEGITLYGRELIIRPRQNSKFQGLRIRSVPPFTYQFNRPQTDPSYSVSPYRHHISPNETTNYSHQPSRHRDPLLNFTSHTNHCGFYNREYSYYSRSEHNLNSLPQYGFPPYAWPRSPPVYLENPSSERRLMNEYNMHASFPSDTNSQPLDPRAYTGVGMDNTRTCHWFQQCTDTFCFDISDKDFVRPGIKDIKHVLVVTSGKGGVGKSTIAAQVAINLWNNKFRVGVLDIDFCGPSIPRILGLENSKIHTCAEGWLPVYADGQTRRFAVMSIGFLLDNPDSSVIWRGPRKGSMVGEFLNSVCWGNIDYLIIDTPPGTSDEHITVLEHLQKFTSNVDVGIIIVSTPQRVSLCDVRREIGFCIKTNIKVIGLIENMSGYVCPNCTQCTNVFSYGGAEALAVEKNVQFLGRFLVFSYTNVYI